MAVVEFSVSRKATDEDTERFDKSWQRFCKRHGLDCDTALIVVYPPSDSSDQELERGKYLSRLWTRCARRALKGDGAAIWKGYVGDFV